MSPDAVFVDAFQLTHDIPDRRHLMAVSLVYGLSSPSNYKPSKRRHIRGATTGLLC
jgi:hypothetical protein